MSEEKKECNLESIYCHDCNKELQKGEKIIIYDLGDKGIFHKCKECYEKKNALDNYQNCEVYSRIVGYIRPVDQWNVGKAEEYKDRKEFNPENKKDKNSNREGSC